MKTGWCWIHRWILGCVLGFGWPCIGWSQTTQWVIRFDAESSPLVAPQTFIGRFPGSVDGFDASDLKTLPPSFTPYLYLAIPHFEWPAPNNSDYQSDIREPRPGAGGDWRIEVRSDTTGRVVNLRWTVTVGNSTETLARSRLLDVERGTVIQPTAGGNYTFTTLTSAHRLTWRVNAIPVVSAGLDRSVSLGDPVQLAQAGFTDEDPNDLHTATVDWGEGDGPVAAQVNQSPGSGTIQANYLYQSIGNFTVSVCAQDQLGARDCDDSTVSVGVPTATPTSTSTPTFTSTGTTTSTRTPSWTSTPSSTVTSTASATHTVTSTRTPSRTSTPASTATPTSSATSSPTATSATSSPTATSSATPSFSPTPTPTRSATATETLTPTGTRLATDTPTTTPLPMTPTRTASPSASQTPAASPTTTLTATASRTATLTPTSSSLPSRTATPTPSRTAASNTPTATLSATATFPGFTPPPPPGGTFTHTPTEIPGSTRTRTPTHSGIPSSTSTSSPTSTRTLTPVQPPSQVPSTVLWSHSVLLALGCILLILRPRPRFHRP